MIAVTFAWSAVGKARGPSAYRSFRATLTAVLPRLPPAQVGPLATTIVVAEAATAAMAALPPLAPLGFALAVLLLGGFTVVLASMLRLKLVTPCNCFGPGRRPVRGIDIVRNAALAAVAGLGAVLTVGDDDGPARWLRGGDQMAYLTVTVALLCVIGLANLAITVRLVRQVGALAKAPGGSSVPAAVEDGPIRVAPGTPVGAFVGEAVDGAPVSSADLDGPFLVGFIAPDCPACIDTLPEFVRRAGAMPGGRRQVLAVVPGDSTTARDLRHELSGVALVVGGKDDVESLMDAFRIMSFPAYALLHGDTMVANHHLVHRLPETIPT